MPIHDLGYRPLPATARHRPLRWWILTEAGIRHAWKSQWLRRSVLAAWLPALAWGFIFFAYETAAKQIEANPFRRPHGWTRDILTDDNPFFPRELLERALEDPTGARADVWSYLLWFFFRSPQAVILVIAIGLIAPPLIARDVRTRAFLLYFSRPLARWQYVLGKAATIWVFAFLVATLPALTLYTWALLLSPTLEIFLDTWQLPLKILLASVTLIVPTTALALTFSALTTESRFAAFGWFAVWVLGWVAYGALLPTGNRWEALSLYHTLGRVQGWIFGVDYDVPTDSSNWPFVAILALVTLLCTAVIFRRISTPMRV